MQNDPSAPSAPPSRGFASIITLVSDVSKDLAALEQTPAQPPPPRVTPSPPPAPQVAPAPPPQQWTPLSHQQWARLSNKHRHESSTQAEPAWLYMLIAFIIFMFVILLSK